MVKALGVAAVILLFGPLATATVTTATGEGYCFYESNYCNNTDTTTDDNTLASYHSTTTSEDWFAFDIPSGATITGATINIWNDGQNSTTDSAALYNLYDAASISFGGLVNGSSLGSISSGDADSGVSQYVSITLNATGLADLNASLGSLFILGGSVDGVGSDSINLFGYTNDGMPAATLTLVQTVTPEPASILLFGTGLLGIVFVMRKRFFA